MDDPRYARLKELLLAGPVMFGEFELAKGGTTDVYVDGRLLSLSAAGAALLGELFWERIAPFEADAVGGMTLGADPIVGAILAEAGRKGASPAGFLVRKEPKGHGTKKSVEGPRPQKERPQVIVVDDTFTTGGSTLDAVARVREEWNADVVGAFCCVDREAGARANFAREGIPMQSLMTLTELRAAR